MSTKLVATKLVAITSDFAVGSSDVVLMAGPCSVESEAQIVSIAKAVKAAGAGFLRGGAFKPRSSPYSFQGLAEDGLKRLAKAREAYDDARSVLTLTTAYDSDAVPAPLEPSPEDELRDALRELGLKVLEERDNMPAFRRDYDRRYVVRLSHCLALRR